MEDSNKVVANPNASISVGSHSPDIMQESQAANTVQKTNFRGMINQTQALNLSNSSVRKVLFKNKQAPHQRHQRNTSNISLGSGNNSSHFQKIQPNQYKQNKKQSSQQPFEQYKPTSSSSTKRILIEKIKMQKLDSQKTNFAILDNAISAASKTENNNK